jgi:hypothetical protein
MSATEAELSSLLASVAGAVFTTQKELDRLANQPSADLPFQPLAFVVKQTQVTLVGNMFTHGGNLSGNADLGLSFELINRVQASLRGNFNAALSSRVSVSIQAVEPTHGG